MLGDFTRPDVLVALVGLALVMLLHPRRVPGAILWSILGATAVGVLLCVTHLPPSLLAWPHSLSQALSLSVAPYLLFMVLLTVLSNSFGTGVAGGCWCMCWSNSLRVVRANCTPDSMCCRCRSGTASAEWSGRIERDSRLGPPRPQLAGTRALPLHAVRADAQGGTALSSSEYLADAAAAGVRYSEFFWNPTGTVRSSGLGYRVAQDAHCGGNG
jgi:hypothetical protein